MVLFELFGYVNKKAGFQRGQPAFDMSINQRIQHLAYLSGGKCK